MHEVIQDGLEDFLGGHARRDFQAHLDVCAECKTEVLEFQQFSGLLQEFREVEQVEPAPGFYFRLSQNLEANRKPSFWSLFSFNSTFGRRLVFASLMTLTVMGGILISQEAGELLPGPEPDAIIASHDFSVSHDSGADRDRMMVTLASYEQ